MEIGVFLKYRRLMEAYRDELISRREKWRANKDNRAGKQEEASGTRQANFTLVAGTELLNEQLKLIKPQVHIFGE